MPHHFEKRPPTVKQYTETYELWSKMLIENAKRIEDSSECRIFLNKNTKTAPWDELLIRAVECIYDLTGDELFLKQVTRDINERRKEDFDDED